jgi:hypothetical protein
LLSGILISTSATVVVNEILLPLCKAYDIHTVYADHYAVGFLQSLIRGAGLHFEPTKKHKSELYLDPLLPLLNSRRIALPRIDRLVNQIASLERSTQRSWRDYIDHPRHGHDDIANAVAIAADLAYNFSLFDIYTLIDGAPRAAHSPVEREAERRRKEADDYYRVDLYRSLGLPPPAPPWGIPRSKTPEQERGESEAKCAVALDDVHAKRWLKRMVVASAGSLSCDWIGDCCHALRTQFVL